MFVNRCGAKENWFWLEAVAYGNYPLRKYGVDERRLVGAGSSWEIGTAADAHQSQPEPVNKKW